MWTCDRSQEGREAKGARGLAETACRMVRINNLINNQGTIACTPNVHVPMVFIVLGILGDEKNP